MNKERLQEIKDSIDFQREFLISSNMQTLCVDEEMELYNEIIRLQQENQQLKKQKDDVVELIKKTPFLYSPFKEEVLRMLGETDE